MSVILGWDALHLTSYNCVVFFFRGFKDPSARRFMHSFHSGDPFVRDDKEYIILTVKGKRLSDLFRYFSGQDSRFVLFLDNLCLFSKYLKLFLCFNCILGQSFMQHHIRKMIGLAIAVIRGFTVEETIHRAFKSDPIDIPKAPGLGLMLEEV